MQVFCAQMHGKYNLFSHVSLGALYFCSTLHFSTLRIDFVCISATNCIVRCSSSSADVWSQFKFHSMHRFICCVWMKCVCVCFITVHDCGCCSYAGDLHSPVHCGACLSCLSGGEFLGDCKSIYLSYWLEALLIENVEISRLGSKSAHNYLSAFISALQGLTPVWSATLSSFWSVYQMQPLFGGG